MLEKIKKFSSYREYLKSLPKDKKGKIKIAKTYVEMPDELWQEFRDDTYKTTGQQIGELIFNSMKAGS